MQIDMLTVAPSAMPATESTGESPEGTTAPESFADLLNAVADESTEAETAGDDAEETAVDEWLTAPVFVPFMPIIPTPEAPVIPEAIEGQLPGGPDVESAQEDGTAIDAIKGVSAAVPPGVGPFESTGEPHRAGLPEVYAAAIEPGTGPSATPTDVEVVGAQAETMLPVDADRPTAESAPRPTADRVEGIAPVLNDSGTSSGKAIEVADPPVVPDAESVPTTQVTAAIAAQSTPAAGGDSSSKSVTTETPIEPTSSPKGVAARFARALERAADPAVPDRVETTEGESSQSFDQSADHRSSFGDSLREHMQPSGADTRSVSAPAFTPAAPAPHDSRIGAVVGSSDTSLVPGGPALSREHDLTLQIVQSLRLQFRDGIGEAVLKLKPEHLGSVAISLRVENGGLKANVQADLPAVRQWLESQQDTLRSALAEHGLRLDRFDVEPDGQRQSSPESRDERLPRKRQARPTTHSEQPVFEVVV
jgi:flagellar hook-length control protein FliK